MHIPNWVKFCPFDLKSFNGNENLISIKGHHSATNLRKIAVNNASLDIVDMNAYTNGEILSTCSQDFDRKLRNERKITEKNKVYTYKITCNQLITMLVLHNLYILQ